MQFLDSYFGSSAQHSQTVSCKTTELPSCQGQQLAPWQARCSKISQHKNVWLPAVQWPPAKCKGCARSKPWFSVHSRRFSVRRRRWRYMPGQAPWPTLLVTVLSVNSKLQLPGFSVSGARTRISTRWLRSSPARALAHSAHTSEDAYRTTNWKKVIHHGAGCSYCYYYYYYGHRHRFRLLRIWLEVQRSAFRKQNG